MGRANKNLIRELEKIVGKDGVLWRPEELLLYEYDASADRAAPDAVVLPHSREQVVHLVRLAHRHGLPLVGRGAGTGLSGGALAPEGGLLMV
ncbi:MAG: FAD-binding oxidoreductase, partial [Terriglobia bacterium]